jgi:hypothetical protein
MLTKQFKTFIMLLPYRIIINIKDIRPEDAIKIL